MPNLHHAVINIGGNAQQNSEMLGRLIKVGTECLRRNVHPDATYEEYRQTVRSVQGMVMREKERVALVERNGGEPAGRGEVDLAAATPQDNPPGRDLDLALEALGKASDGDGRIPRLDVAQIAGIQRIRSQLGNRSFPAHHDLVAGLNALLAGSGAVVRREQDSAPPWRKGDSPLYRTTDERLAELDKTLDGKLGRDHRATPRLRDTSLADAMFNVSTGDYDQLPPRPDEPRRSGRSLIRRLLGRRQGDPANPLDRPPEAAAGDPSGVRTPADAEESASPEEMSHRASQAGHYSPLPVGPLGGAEGHYRAPPPPARDDGSEPERVSEEHGQMEER